MEDHNKHYQSENPNMANPMANASRLLRATIQVGEDPLHRICKRYESGISPTLVSRDKKAYSIDTSMTRKLRDISKIEERRNELQKTFLGSAELRIGEAK